MKYLIIIFFFTLKAFGQFGYIDQGFPYPNFEDAEYGYPDKEYFKLCGNNYKLILYESKDFIDLTLKRRSLSSFRLKGNRIKARTKNSRFSFVHRNKYILRNDTIFNCSRWWRIEPSVKTIPKTVVTEKDSAILQWIYNVNGSVWKSYRRTYNKKGKIVKYEVAWEYYAYNDSTWALADKNCDFTPVQREIYDYLTETEIKITYERKGKNKSDVKEKTVKLEYNDRNQLIKELYYENNINTSTVRYYFTGNICNQYEYYKNGNLVRKINLEYPNR
jgi:hypothetical protein